MTEKWEVLKHCKESIYVVELFEGTEDQVKLRKDSLVLETLKKEWRGPSFFFSYRRVK